MDLDLIARVLGSMGVTLGLYSRFTNPFMRWSRVGWRMEIDRSGKQWEIISWPRVDVRKNWYWRSVALFKAAWHILAGVIKVPRPRKVRLSHDEIIARIHQLRFGEKTPFLISGDHFSVLYVRSLGIFYASLLDSRTALSQDDWDWRQLVYLKTTILVLEAASKCEDMFTTLVPVGGSGVAPLQIYAYPSDSLYSIFYALDNMKRKDGGIGKYELKTRDASNGLVEKYKSSLRRHWERYYEKVVDKETGGVRDNLYLSGTKDMAKRRSAFYDAVMVWATGSLAESLGVGNEGSGFWDEYKERLIENYWDDNNNWWREELEEASRYSSDWLIGVQTGMLSIGNSRDKAILEKAVKKMEEMNLDKPVPLAYHHDLRLEQLHWPVRWGAKWYGSRAIWSHWGIEYIKLELGLYESTRNKDYLEKAEGYLDKYRKIMEENQGYPEVLRPNGKIYKTGFYRSIINNGWVVNYQQARVMHEDLRVGN